MNQSNPITEAPQGQSSLREWSLFLYTLNSNLRGGKPLLKKAENPRRLLDHLESKLASPAFEFA